MKKSTVVLITYMMLFFGFPFVTYTIAALGNGSFNAFEWSDNNPSMILVGLATLVSLGTGIAFLNDDDYNDYDRRY